MPRILIIASIAAASLAVARSGSSSSPAVELPIRGLITPSQTVEVTASVDGLLQSVDVDRSDVVAAGAVVATLESSVQKAALDLAKARAAAIGALRTREARVEYATAKLAQDQALHEKGLLSELELTTSRSDKKVADADLIAARESLEMAALEQAQAEAALALRSIVSPFDGVVVERYLSPGELLTRQSESKILKLAQISPLRVEVILPVERFGSIEVGSRATVTPLGPGFAPREATVTVIDKLIDAASNTFGVRLEIPNEDGETAAGLKCEVAFDAPI